MLSQASGALSVSETVDLSQRDSLAKLAYTRLREELMSGLWEPAQALTIRGQAERFRISPTPVREAMLQLTHEHALLLGARSFSVPVLDRRAFLELRQLRVTLEAMLVREAVQGRGPLPGLATSLRGIHDQLITAKSSNDYRAVMVLNRRFHFELYRHADMPHALAIVESLWARTGPYQHSLYGRSQPIDAGRHDHLRVIAALRVGDAMAAAAAIVDDITVRGVHADDVDPAH